MFAFAVLDFVFSIKPMARKNISDINCFVSMCRSKGANPACASPYFWKGEDFPLLLHFDWSTLQYNRHFRILKMIATSGFLAALECTKFVFGRGSVPDPLGELTVLPQTP